MNTPPKGHYRTIIGSKHPDVRIAFTNQPIIGCREINKAPIIEAFKESKDVHAEFYAVGLQNGTLVVIVENSSSDKYFRPGELYFTT